MNLTGGPEVSANPWGWGQGDKPLASFSFCYGVPVVPRFYPVLKGPGEMQVNQKQSAILKVLSFGFSITGDYFFHGVFALPRLYCFKEQWAPTSEVSC